MGYRHKKENPINLFLRCLLPCLSSLINTNYSSQCKLCRISSYQHSSENVCLYSLPHIKCQIDPSKKHNADNRITAILEHKFVVRKGKTLCSVSSGPNKIIAKSFVLKKLIDKFGFTTKVTGTCSIEGLNKHAE